MTCISLALSEKPQPEPRGSDNLADGHLRIVDPVANEGRTRAALAQLAGRRDLAVRQKARDDSDQNRWQQKQPAQPGKQQYATPSTNLAFAGYSIDALIY